jgi:hypothetical protein
MTTSRFDLEAERWRVELTSAVEARLKPALYAGDYRLGSKGGSACSVAAADVASCRSTTRVAGLMSMAGLGAMAHGRVDRGTRSDARAMQSTSVTRGAVRDLFVSRSTPVRRSGRSAVRARAAAS